MKSLAVLFIILSQTCLAQDERALLAVALQHPRVVPAVAKAAADVGASPASCETKMDSGEYQGKFLFDFRFKCKGNGKRSRLAVEGYFSEGLASTTPDQYEIENIKYKVVPLENKSARLDEQALLALALKHPRVIPEVEKAAAEVGVPVSACKMKIDAGISEGYQTRGKYRFDFQTKCIANGKQSKLWTNGFFSEGLNSTRTEQYEIKNFEYYISLADSM